ncbi:MAG: SHOCT domain-containing protein [Gallionellaceae bacterium]|nr:SHOCT domain-containing protein [Gallionellaceae bacterium]
MYGFDHFGMGYGGFGMILVWLLPLALLYVLFRMFSGKHRDAGGHKSALAILEERYARGEIERDDYLKRRADLQA